jgi:hypothetical protein
MAARLRFQQQSEGRIAGDLDPLDRVHLNGGFEIHGRFLPSMRGALAPLFSRISHCLNTELV